MTGGALVAKAHGVGLVGSCALVFFMVPMEHHSQSRSS